MGYDRDYGRGRGYQPQGQRDWRAQDDYRREPSGYDRDDRGFFDRAGDEVRSWFGDEEAERRRRLDERYGERSDRAGADHWRRSSGYGGGSTTGGAYGTGGYYPSSSFEGSAYGEGGVGQDEYGRDRFRGYGSGARHEAAGRFGGGDDYGRWRQQQIDALDRDYDEYRRHNQSRFDSEFGSWRNRRSQQRTSLDQVNEHMEVVGSDGEHLGTVDKVRGDRIILTKNDQAAGGHHHSIPSLWIDRVDERVTLDRTADQARQQWRDEERKSALFGEHEDRGNGPHILDRSFAGTYRKD